MTNFPDDVIPEGMGPFIQALIEGRVKQFVLVVELDDGSIMDCMPRIDEEGCDHYRMLGAIESVKRDYMRLFIDSRWEYADRPAGDDDGEEG